MNLHLANPQLFYVVIVRIPPGFLLLFVLRACLAGTGIEPGFSSNGLSIILAHENSRLKRKQPLPP